MNKATLNLPPLPLPPLPALPPLYSIWFPICRDPWQPGWYEAQCLSGAVWGERVHWNGVYWDQFPYADIPGAPELVAWRGLAQPC